MGAIWFCLTITFEFAAGHYVFGNPWEKLLADYNILEGRIWSLVLLTILLAPYHNKQASITQNKAFWRREWDLNPRGPQRATGSQGLRISPLCHPGVVYAVIG